MLVALSSVAVDYTAQIKSQVARQECHPSDLSKDEVVVCARRKDRRYRVSEEFAPTELERQRPNSVRERARWIEGGESGTNSCSPVGPGGWTGCMQNRWKKARQQAKGWYGL